MHIEPGLVDASKIFLSYATGAAALGYSARLALDMLEKASACGVRLLVAPGAPSLAAVELARTVNTTILGFVRQGNINIYTCPHRII